jgi:hypothetical protein
MSPNAPSSTSCTRRKILGWGSAGTLSGLAAYLGWPRNEVKSSPHDRKDPADFSRSHPAEPLSQEIVTQDSAGFRREDFLPHLKTEFQLESVGAACKLIEVSEARALTAPTAKFTCFSLIFAAHPNLLIESQIHRITHPEMQAMELFLSPIGHSEDRVYLEAAFSQQV